MHWQPVANCNINKEIWSHDASVFRNHLAILPGDPLPCIEVVLHIGKCMQKKPGYWVESNAYKGIDDQG